MSTATIDRVIIPDDLSRETLVQMQDQIQKRLEEPQVKVVPEKKSKAKKKAEEKVLKKAKALRKAEKKAKEAAKAKKAKAKKAKSKGKRKGKRKGLNRAAHALVVVPVVTSGKTLRKGGRAIARGARWTGRKTKAVGRKMWSWAVGGATWAYSKAKWAALGLKAGAGKVIGYVGAGMAYTWALVALGGFTVLALVGLTAKKRTKGRKAVEKAWLKELKMRRKARKARQDAVIALKALEIADAKQAKADAKAALKAKKDRRAEQDRQTAEALANVDLDEVYTPEEQEFIDVVSAREFEKLDMDGLAIGVAKKVEELMRTEVPEGDKEAEAALKKEYSFYDGMNQALTTVALGNPKRGKPLYNALKSQLTNEQRGDTPDKKRRAALKVYDWSEFYEGVLAACERDLQLSNLRANAEA